MHLRGSVIAMLFAVCSALGMPAMESRWLLLGALYIYLFRTPWSEMTPLQLLHPNDQSLSANIDDRNGAWASPTRHVRFVRWLHSAPVLLWRMSIAYVPIVDSSLRNLVDTSRRGNTGLQGEVPYIIHGIRCLSKLTAWEGDCQGLYCPFVYSSSKGHS